MRRPTVSRTGEWQLTSGTVKKRDAGSQRSVPARKRLAAWTMSRPDSATVEYQQARTSPLGQTHTAEKWLWCAKIGPQASGGMVEILPAAVKSMKYGPAGASGGGAVGLTSC